MAPWRSYSCSTRTGCPGRAGRVGARRGRGCSEVSSSRLNAASCAPRSPVSRSATARVRRTNAASRGALGGSQACTRQGFNRRLARMRCTVRGEIVSTIAARISWRANSVQSHWLSERPTRSGSSQASRTVCSATSGGKERPPTGPWPIAQAVQPLGPEAVQPVAYDVALDAHLRADVAQRHPSSGQQHDPRPPRQAGLDRRAAGKPDQRGPGVRSQLDPTWTLRPRPRRPSRPRVAITIASGPAHRQWVTILWGPVLRIFSGGIRWWDSLPHVRVFSGLVRRGRTGGSLRATLV